MWTKKSKQKQNQVMSYTNWPCLLLFDLVPNNAMVSLKDGFILMFSSAWCLVMAQIQFFLVEKTNWMSRTLAYPPPPTLPSPPPPKSKLWKGCFFAFFLSSCPHVFEEIILRLFQVFFSVNKIMIENIAIDLKKIKTCNSSLFFILTPNFYQ